MTINGLINRAKLATGTWAQLAAAVGVHNATVWRWRRGTLEPTLSQGVRLAELAKCSLHGLVERTNDG